MATKTEKIKEAREAVEILQKAIGVIGYGPLSEELNRLLVKAQGRYAELTGKTLP